MTIHVHPLSDKTVEQRLAATSCHSSETQRATPLLSLNAMTIHACQSNSKSLFHSSSVPDTSLLHSSPLPQQRQAPRPLIFHLRHHWRTKKLKCYLLKTWKKEKQTNKQRLSLTGMLNFPCNLVAHDKYGEWKKKRKLELDSPQLGV